MAEEKKPNRIIIDRVWSFLIDVILKAKLRGTGSNQENNGRYKSDFVAQQLCRWVGDY